MNFITKILFFFAVSLVFTKEAKAGFEPKPDGNNDTSVNIKSNIVIFKMITSPQNANTGVSGTLKKAGKVARTSNSATSLKTPIILPKRNL